MKTGFWLSAIALALLTACAGHLKPGDTYTSRLGAFTCGPFSEPMGVDESFGPKGGTVRLWDQFRMIRIDVEQFEPPIDDLTLAQKRSSIYEHYLEHNILPLVQSGASGSRLLGSKAAEIKGRSVLVSAILIPEGSGLIDSAGKRADGVRGQAQYTNGQFMYTASATGDAWRKTTEQQINGAYWQAERAFTACAFP